MWVTVEVAIGDHDEHPATRWRVADEPASPHAWFWVRFESQEVRICHDFLSPLRFATVAIGLAGATGPDV